jgi:hypothetical protein
MFYHGPSLASHKQLAMGSSVSLSEHSESASMLLTMLRALSDVLLQF